MSSSGFGPSRCGMQVACEGGVTFCCYAKFPPRNTVTGIKSINQCESMLHNLHIHMITLASTADVPSLNSTVSLHSIATQYRYYDSTGASLGHGLCLCALFSLALGWPLPLCCTTTTVLLLLRYYCIRIPFVFTVFPCCAAASAAPLAEPIGATFLSSSPPPPQPQPPVAAALAVLGGRGEGDPGLA